LFSSTDYIVLEHAFTCPHCWETITFLLDLSEPEQSYVEDCEVCCNPIHVRFTAAGGVLEAFSAARID
jgi:transcription elongation factor Elf1